MREMTGTEILEREIREEASRRAARLIDQAMREAADLRAAAAAALETELAGMTAAHQALKARRLADLSAAQPLERQRRRLAFLGRELEREVAAVLAALSETAWWAVVGPRLVEAAAGLGDGELRVRWSNAGNDPLGRLRGLLPGREVRAVEAGDGAAGRWVELERADGRRRYRIGDGELAAWLLETHRAELAETLFPGLWASGGEVFYG